MPSFRRSRMPTSAPKLILGLVLLSRVGAPTPPVLAAAPIEQDAPKPLLLKKTDTSVNLTAHVAILEDCTSALTLGDVSTGPAARTFRRTASHSLNFGYTACTLWVRLDVACQATMDEDWLLVLENPRVDHIDLYRDGTVERSGSTVAMSHRLVRSRYPAFTLGRLPAGASRFFVRLQTSDVASYPLSLIRRHTFTDAMPLQHMVLGMYFGIMLLTALLSAIVFAYLRDSAYLLYALFIASYAAFETSVNGLDIEFLCPEHPWWIRPAIPVWCGLTVFSGAAFSARFLLLRQYAPSLRHLFHWILLASATLVAVGAAGAFTTGGILGSLLAPIAVASFGAAGVIAMVRGCPHAKHFLLAGALQFLGVILNALRNFSLIPTTFVTTYGSQIGSTLFTLLVSIALMARFDRLRREKEHAQSEALRSHQSASEAKRVTAELRLEALQAKINPHFLFNTLNTIAGLIAESPSRAQGVVVRLSRLFRFTLTATTKDRVLLTEELAIVRSYLEIEQERFGDRLRFDITVNGEIENISLPGLTIQPLVENSVKHGLRSKVEGGRVEVWVRVESENVLITVADDGVGMDTTISTNGHGLHSVRERLRLVYGKAASMTLTSPPGLRIDIRLPARS
jgi:hypothetical protein